MPDSPPSATCGLCGAEASGSALPKLFQQPVHKKCKDRFVLAREVAWVLDALLFLGVPRILTVFFLLSGKPARAAEEDPALSLVALAFAILFLFKDAVRGLSPGKLAMGLQVVDVRTGEPIGPLQSLQRNLITLIPFAPIVLAFQMRGGPRWGEGWANTRVVERARRAQQVFGGTQAPAEDWSSRPTAR